MAEKLLEQEMRVHIRWMIERDMAEILEIEEESFEFPWLDYDFIRYLKRSNCIGMVAEYEDQVIGFMVYELHKHKIHALNFAVHPNWRRRGVGSQLLSKLAGKLSMQSRSRIVLEVRETNLPAQLFFRENSFRAVSVLKNFYTDSPEDAYVMQRSYEQKAISQIHRFFNRITSLAR